MLKAQRVPTGAKGQVNKISLQASRNPLGLGRKADSGPEVVRNMAQPKDWIPTANATG